jgi:glycosyltransferase involved in cell wall biosynthesis
MKAKNKIEISIVVPTLNEEELISDCLNHLSNQNIDINYEIIAVDNNSADRTIRVVKKYIHKHKNKNIIILKEPKKSVAYARQKGFEKARGEIIASTDADSRVPCNWLLQIINNFKKHPEISAVGGPYSFYDETLLIKILRKPITKISIILDKMCGWGKNHFPGANFAILKKDFQKVGGFDKSLFFGEDLELSIRLHKAGKKILFDKKMIISVASRRYKGHIIKGVWQSYGSYSKMIIVKKIIPWWKNLFRNKDSIAI